MKSGIAMTMMKQVRQNALILIDFLLIIIARNIPKKKLVNVAKTAHTSVQPKIFQMIVP